MPHVEDRWLRSGRYGKGRRWRARYTDPDGRRDASWNVNGATHAIAGVLSEKHNVLGLMPHPENHVEAILGSTDGRGLFAGLVDHFVQAA